LWSYLQVTTNCSKVSLTHKVLKALYNHLVATSRPRSDGPSEVWMRRRNEVTHKDGTGSNDGDREAMTSAETETERGEFVEKSGLIKGLNLIHHHH
jgi:hypothetical protein